LEIPFGISIVHYGYPAPAVFPLYLDHNTTRQMIRIFNTRSPG
jgi:hypothetical protein